MIDKTIMLLPVVFSIVGIFAILLVESFRWTRWIALVSSILSSIVTLTLVSIVIINDGDPLLYHVNWIPSYSAHFSLKLLSWQTPYLIISSLLFPFLIGIEWNRSVFKRGLLVLILLFQTTQYGIVLSNDLFLFYFFWFLSSVLGFFLLGLWGNESSPEATQKMITQHALSNVFVFMGVLFVYFLVTPHTFYLDDPQLLSSVDKKIVFFGFELSLKRLAFLFISIGFAVRTPLLPFSSWYRKAAKEMSCSHLFVVLLSNAGVAFFVFATIGYQIFKNEINEFSKIFLIYGAIQACYSLIFLYSKQSIKEIYAELTTLLFSIAMITFGLSTIQGLLGAVLFVFAGLFSLMGLAILFDYLMERANTDNIAKMGDLKQKDTIGLVCGAIIMLSVVALPGTVGFIGFSTYVIGLFEKIKAYTLVVVFIFVLMQVFLLRLYYLLFLQTKDKEILESEKINKKYKFALVPISALLIVFGVFSYPLIKVIKQTTITMIVGSEPAGTQE